MFLTSTCIITCACLWYLYLRQKKQLEDEYNAKEDEYKKLNCVVTLSRIHGITGWPGFKNETTEITCTNYRDVFEPILYFLEDTRETLDIAVMAVTSNIILSTLLSLLKRGIKLRLLLNYDHITRKHTVKELLKHGADIAIYVGTDNTGSIFHYKYAIKDYNTKTRALYCGSLNWTNAGFTNNFESLLFTTNEMIIDEFYKNYNESFAYVKHLMEENTYVKVKLKSL